MGHGGKATKVIGYLLLVSSEPISAGRRLMAEGRAHGAEGKAPRLNSFGFNGASGAGKGHSAMAQSEWSADAE